MTDLEKIVSVHGGSRQFKQLTQKEGGLSYE